MKPITLAGFSGSNKVIDPYLLPENVGVSVYNAEPGRGDLRPLSEPLTVATVPASPQRLSIWRMGRDVVNDTLYWLNWSSDVNATLGFDGADTTERTYYTGSGTPKWTDNVFGLAGGSPYPQATRELAVPAPSSAATVVQSVAGNGTEAYVYFVHTFVNDLGWESAPSPVSYPLSAKAGATFDISSLPAAPAGNYGITLRRIYRTQSDGSSNANFFFLRELAIGATSTTDDARDLGDALSTEGWIPPPAAGKGLIALWNGMMALGSGKTLHISAVGAPYAYPIRYDIELPATFVACGKWEQNLLVLTTGLPVLVQGQDPEGLSDAPLSVALPCMAARSVVSFGDGVVWASNEGLAYYGAKGQGLFTERIISAKQWRALVPTSMVAGRYGRLYVCSYNDGSVRRGFIIDPGDPGAGITWLSTGFDACHYDPIADALYILEGTNVRKFDGNSTTLTATFTSKIFKQTAPVNFAFAKVVATGYPVTLKVWSETRHPLTNIVTMQLRRTKTVYNADAFVLPGGFLSEDWQLEVSSDKRVIAVRLASNIEDFRGL